MRKEYRPSIDGCNMFSNRCRSAHIVSYDTSRRANGRIAITRFGCLLDEAFPVGCASKTGELGYFQVKALIYISCCEDRYVETTILVSDHALDAPEEEQSCCIRVWLQ